MKPFRDRAGPYVDHGLFLLSVTWIGLFVINWILPDKNFPVPCTALCWPDLLAWTRVLTWIAFLSIWLIMGFTSHRAILWRHKPDGRNYYLFTNNPDNQSYLRKWWLEALICVTWVPFVLIGPLENQLVAQAMLSIGGAAHVARVSNFIQRKLTAHPVVTACASTITLLTFASVVLMLAEPDRYTNFHETARSLLRDGLTIGGDIKPDTELGKDLNTLWIVAATGVLAVFFALVREFVQYVCFRHGDPVKKIIELLEKLLEKREADHKALRAKVARLETMVEALLAKEGVPLPPSDGDG
jgi:hypothetical protein